MNKKDLAKMILELNTVSNLLQAGGTHVEYNGQNCLLFTESLKDVGARVRNYSVALMELLTEGFNENTK